MALVAGRGTRGTLIAGRACAVAGWVLWVVMQALAGDPFPPEISVSQYGLGPTGWVFTVWALALAAAPLLLLPSLPPGRVPAPASPGRSGVDGSRADIRPPRAGAALGPATALRPAAALLWAGFAGAAVMAVVRTDEGGGAMSGHARIHMAGAVVALVFLPAGILLALRDAEPWARRSAAVLAVAAAVTGTLVVVSATGVDTVGWGAPRSWALWQGTLIVLEMLMVGVSAVAAGRTRIGVVRAGR